MRHAAFNRQWLLEEVERIAPLTCASDQFVPFYERSDHLAGHPILTGLLASVITLPLNHLGSIHGWVNDLICQPYSVLDYLEFKEHVMTLLILSEANTLIDLLVVIFSLLLCLYSSTAKDQLSFNWHSAPPPIPSGFSLFFSPFCLAELRTISLSFHFLVFHVTYLSTVLGRKEGIPPGTSRRSVVIHQRNGKKGRKLPGRCLYHHCMQITRQCYDTS